MLARNLNTSISLRTKCPELFFFCIVKREALLKMGITCNLGKQQHYLSKWRLVFTSMLTKWVGHKPPPFLLFIKNKITFSYSVVYSNHKIMSQWCVVIIYIIYTIYDMYPYMSEDKTYLQHSLKVIILNYYDV